MTEAEQAAALAEAWSGTVTPYSQVRDTFGPEVGQYDWLVKSLTPKVDDDGCYYIEGEFSIALPAELRTTPAWRRSLYVGTKRQSKDGRAPDPMAKLPETRLNSPGIRFLKLIAKASGTPINDQADSTLCGALIGKGFGCPVVEGKPYKDKATGEEKAGGVEFGRNVTPAGTVPASGPFRMRTMNGAAGQPMVAQPTGAAADATFATE